MVSVERFVVNTSSALVALVTSAVNATVLPVAVASTYVFVAFSLGYFMSEFEASVLSVLLLATSSLVDVNTFSANVALVTSLFRLAFVVASAAVRLMVSVERFVVNI